MVPKVLMAVMAASVAVPQIAVSQTSYQSDLYSPPQTSSTPQISEAQLLAGVRAYPPGTIKALLKLSEHPDVLNQLAQDPQKLMNPSTISPPIPTDLQTAIRQLQQMPEAVPLAAAFPDDMARLRQLYQSDPTQTEQRLAELRGRYQAARLQGDKAWQQMLAQNPRALAQYQDLVTQFTRDQLKQYPQFPYVVVAQPQYYEAAPPNDLILAFAADRDTPEPLDSLLDDWASAHGPDVLDQQASSQAPLAAVDPSTLAALQPQQRSAMWRPAAGAAPSDAALLPIIMQPMTDQPPDARLAYAVAENARLWGEAAPSEQPPVANVPQEEEGLLPEYQPQAEAAPPNVAEEYPQYQPDYYYGYTPNYSAPDYYAPNYYGYASTYYSPLVPYYYSYPSVWPLAYSYYPGLYYSWPFSYYPYYGFAFNYGYGPHFYHYGHFPYYYNRFARFGPYRGFYDRYYGGFYGRGFYGRPFYGRGFYAGRGFYGNRFYGGGRGFYAGRGFYGNRFYGDRFYGAGFRGDRFYAGRGGAYGNRFYAGRGFNAGVGRGGDFRGGRAYGERGFVGSQRFGLAGSRSMTPGAGTFRGPSYGLAGSRSVTPRAIGPRTGGFSGGRAAIGGPRGGGFRGGAAHGGGGARGGGGGGRGGGGGGRR